MRNIAIVEDDNNDAGLLISYIERYSAASGQKFKVWRLDRKSVV